MKKTTLTYSESSLLLALLKKRKSEVEGCLETLESMTNLLACNKQAYTELYEHEMYLINGLCKKLDI